MPLLTVDDVSLNFGGVKALANLSLAVQPGVLHGLIGPNGAGKTTAMNVICGIYRPTSGTMTFRDAAFQPRPHRLAAAGLARTFQAAATIASLRAYDNVLLGGYARTRAGIIGSALKLPGPLREELALRELADAALEEVGFTGPKNAPMSELSTWQRRQLEIARALLCQPRLLLLDEPAAGLTAAETASLKALLLRLRDRGAGKTSIMLVEHNVPLVFSLCDEITAMAEGKQLVQGPRAVVRSHPEVIRAYLGAGVKPDRPPPTARRASDRPVVLALEHVSAGYGPNTVLHGVSLEIRPNGAGKTTLFNAIIGERRASAGSITWQGKRIENRPVQAIVRAGIGIVPQGRAVLERQSVEDNLLVSTIGLNLGKRAFQQRLDETFERFPALKRRRKSLGASLSGGERQLLSIAKTLIRQPRLLLLDEPSIGLAPTMVEELQHIVERLSHEGLAVMIGEQAVNWVVPLADRAYAISAGRIVRSGPAETLADANELADQYLGAQESPAMSA
jgi:ABC-type branched-subunit amino acid transport system ATPase component